MLESDNNDSACSVEIDSGADRFEARSSIKAITSEQAEKGREAKGWSGKDSRIVHRQRQAWMDGWMKTPTNRIFYLNLEFNERHKFMMLTLFCFARELKAAAFLLHHLSGKKIARKKEDEVDSIKIAEI